MTSSNKPIFAVIGGDRRISAVAQCLREDGFEVRTFATAEGGSSTLQTALEGADTVVLPIPMTKDGSTLYAPFYNGVTELDDIFKLASSAQIFAGLVDKDSGYNVTDYYDSEQLKILNALPTAEGAIQIAMRNTDYTISGSRCLISGFGRISKVLAPRLRALGADVTISARKPQDMAWIESLGYTPVHTSRIAEIAENKNIFFNTIPHIIYDARTLLRVNKKALIIDLASAPGGVDIRSAEEMGLRVISAPGLPGRTAPLTAGKYIKQTVLNLLK